MDSSEEIIKLRQEIAELREKQEQDVAIAYEERKQIKVRLRIFLRRFQKVSSFVLLFVAFTLLSYAKNLSDEWFISRTIEPQAIKPILDAAANLTLFMSLGVWFGKPGEAFASFLSTTLKIPIPLPSSSKSDTNQTEVRHEEK